MTRAALTLLALLAGCAPRADRFCGAEQYAAAATNRDGTMVECVEYGRQIHWPLLYPGRAAPTPEPTPECGSVIHLEVPLPDSLRGGGRE